MTTQQIRQRMIQLEQELVQLRHMLDIAMRGEDVTADNADRDESNLAFQINTAMGFVVHYQDSTRPFVFMNETQLEVVRRDPHPKEQATMGAACDLLERYFDRKGIR